MEEKKKKTESKTKSEERIEQENMLFKSQCKCAS